jgi:hypothetical protein
MDYDENENELLEWVDCNVLGLNDGDEREKLISLISKVLERLQSEDREILMYKRGVRFIAPITINCVAEQVFINPMFSRDERYEPMLAVWLVCLSPDILKRSKVEAIYTLAHELAHVYLEHSKHFGTPNREGLLAREKEADKQVIKWGFKLELQQSPFNYIYGDGEI